MSIEYGTPSTSYGILRQSVNSSPEDSSLEQLLLEGYTVLDSGFSDDQKSALALEFDTSHSAYVSEHGEERLAAINEYYTIRAPMLLGSQKLRSLAFNNKLLALVDRAIEGAFVLNQQNGIINPPGERYNQGQWHCDFPYQHFITDRPLGVNALYCVDDFSMQNGATFVLPGSHRTGALPSIEHIERSAVQIEAPAGSYLVLDCMLYHAGGPNLSEASRRAVNHVYTIPFFKQQINLPGNLPREDFSPYEQRILGFDYQEPRSVSDYLASRTETSG